MSEAGRNGARAADVPRRRLPGPGDQLSARWAIARVELAEGAIHFVVTDRNGLAATLRLDADHRTSRTSPLRPLSFEASGVSAAELHDAAQSLTVGLIHASRAGNPFRSFDELVVMARAAGALELTTAPTTWELVLAEGGLSFVPPSGLAEPAEPIPAEVARVLEALERGTRPLRVTGLAADARSAFLVELARAVELARRSLRVRYRASEASPVEATALSALATWLSAESARPVELVVELVDQPFALLVKLPQAVRDHALFRGGLRSAAGRPLCWLAHDPPCEAGTSRTLPRPSPDDDPAGTFGPGCASCHVRAQCGGVTARYAERFGWDELRPLLPDVDGKASWEARVRWMLVDRPYRSVRLGDVVPHLPDIPCVRPWTRFELHEGGTYGPCGSDIMAVPAETFPEEPDLPALWNGDLLRKFRRAMSTSTSTSPSTCRPVCPVLVGRTDAIEHWWMRGGSAVSVENQIRTARAMLEGEDDVDFVPVSFNVATTSFCNYDCLMCNCGREGTLADEKKSPFYDRLAAWEDRLIIVEANGGEPLASRHYRDFVKRFAASDRPDSLQITTNGSLMTEAWLESLPRIPFTKICVSLNAASHDTYLAVNRGITWAAIRKNVEALLRLRSEGRYRGHVTYSMVVLRRNLHEVRAFADMAIRDGTEVRFMLPMRELDGQTVMTSPAAMRTLAEALEDVIARLGAHGMAFSKRDAEARLEVLRQRLEAGVFEPL